MKEHLRWIAKLVLAVTVTFAAMLFAGSAVAHAVPSAAAAASTPYPTPDPHP